MKAVADHGFNLIRVPMSAQLINEWAAGKYPQANYNQAYNAALTKMNSLEIFEYFLTLAEAYVTLLAIMVVFLTEVIEQLTATANVVGIQIGNHGLYTFDIALLQLVIDGRREL